MDPAIVIDPATGAIRLGERDTLMPWARISAIAPRVADLLRHRQDFGTGYKWLYLHKLSLGGHPAHLSLCFKRGRLEMVTFGVDLPGAREGWPGGPEIEAEIAFLRQILSEMVGFNPCEPSLALPWGSVWSDHDPKADIASSGLHYA